LDGSHERDVILVAGNQYGYVIVFAGSVEEHICGKSYVDPL